MTEREKLIELVRESNILAHCGCHYNDIDYYTKQLADHLLENGVVVLPCKVGDTVYYAQYGEVLEATVIEVELNYFTTPQEWITIEYNSPYTSTQKYKSRIDLMFGKTIFLTKKEAQKALAERRAK